MKYITTCRNAGVIAGACGTEAIAGLFQLAYNEADMLDEDVYVDVVDELVEELDKLIETLGIVCEKDSKQST